MTKPNLVHVGAGKSAQDLTTKQLIRGLYVGYQFSMFEMEAVRELANRGETNALIEAYQKSTRVFVKACIERNVEVPAEMVKARREARKRVQR